MRKPVTRCGAATASGECRRRVSPQGGPCYLHPPFTVTRDRGTVRIEVRAYVIVETRGRGTTVALVERDALELARAIQRACTQLDTEGEPT